MRRLLQASALSVALAASVLGCSSSGDGGVTGTNDFLNAGAEVTPRTATMLEYVDITEASGTRTSTCLAIDAHRAFGVFAAAFTLQYDPASLRYRSFDDGATCLGDTSVRLPAQVDATQPGLIIVGVTRNAAATTTGVTCGRLIELCFDVIGEGDTQLTFVGNRQLIGPPPAGAPVAVEWVTSDLKTRL